MRRIRNDWFEDLFNNFTDTYEEVSKNYDDYFNTNFFLYETEELEKEIKITVEVPGITLDKIKITTEASKNVISLNITKNKKGKEVVHDKKFIVNNCDLENTLATLKNGILTLSVPKLSVNNKIIPISEV